MAIESAFIDSLIRVLFSMSYFGKNLLAQTYISQHGIPKTSLKIMEYMGTWVAQLSAFCLGRNPGMLGLSPMLGFLISGESASPSPCSCALAVLLSLPLK